MPTDHLLASICATCTPGAMRIASGRLVAPVRKIVPLLMTVIAAGTRPAGSVLRDTETTSTLTCASSSSERSVRPFGVGVGSGVGVSCGEATGEGAGVGVCARAMVPTLRSATRTIRGRAHLTRLWKIAAQARRGHSYMCATAPQHAALARLPD